MDTCSICGEPYERGGNSAYPCNDGRCCNYCDCLVVTPIRLSRSTGKPRENFVSLGYNILTELKKRREGSELRRGEELHTGE